MRNENIVLVVQKRTLPEIFTYLIFIIPFFLSFLQSFLGLPSIVKYIIDVCWLGTLVSLLLVKKAYIKKDVAPALWVIIAFFSTALIVYLFNFQSPFYFLWGIRNNLRFYIAFIAFTIYFDSEDIKSCFKFMDVIFWINAIVVFFQFFVLGYEQDYLGGIFGVERGCNSYLIIFFVIVLNKSILNYFNDEENAFFCFIKCGVILLISAMAELKFFFVIFIIILIVASAITRFSWKKVFLYIISFMLIMAASVLIVEIFGENKTINIYNIIDLIFATNYSSSRDLGRFTAIPTINARFLKEPLEKLFGFGLGNCDTSSFAICNTPFYRSYSYLNYNWFSSAFLFLETGFVGLFLFLFFFVMVFVLSYKKSKQESANMLFCQMGMIMSIVCFILTFYNSSLRTETGYMAYFVLALPFVNASEVKTSRI